MSSASEAAEKKKVAFDAEAASMLVKDLRATFASGKTRSYEWRVSQLNALIELADAHEQQIIDALFSDLAKPPLETVVYEVALSSALSSSFDPPLSFVPLGCVFGLCFFCFSFRFSLQFCRLHLIFC